MAGERQDEFFLGVEDIRGELTALWLPNWSAETS